MIIHLTIKGQEIKLTEAILILISINCYGLQNKTPKMRNAKTFFLIDSRFVAKPSIYKRIHIKAAKVSAGTDLSVQVNFITTRQFKLTRKEYLRRFAGNKQNNPYNDKMLDSIYNVNHPRNYKNDKLRPDPFRLMQKPPRNGRKKKADTKN